MFLYLLSVLLLPLALGFTFTANTNSPTQCGVVSVDWSGGTPPFHLMILPAYDYPSNISLPTSAWNSASNSGKYSWTVNYPKDTDFVLLMSDASGTGTGGVSPLYKVGASTNSSACTLRPDQTDFLFYLNETSVNQCDPVQVYWDNTATNPVTVLGVIPGGQPFQFTQSGGTSLVWNTNIAAKTQFILAAFDNGKYGTGGSSALMTVGAGTSACLDDSSPSSTPVGSPSSTATGTKTGGGVKTVTAITTATPKGAAGLSTGSIVGIAVGAIVAVLILQGFLFYFCCRRQLAALLSHRRQMRDREVKAGEVDLVDDPGQEGQDRPTSLHDVRTGGGGSMSNRLTSIFPGSRTRSSLTDTHDGESSVSPFWEPNPNAAGHGTLNDVERGPFDTPPGEDEDFLPPQRAHLRNDSLSSTNSSSNPNPRPLTLNLDNSPSMLSLPTFSPTAPLMPNSIPGSSRQPPSQGYQSKAQMAAAMSMSASNPDGPSDPDLFSRQQPRPDLPPGGFRLHEDAGRAEEVEELPPMYRPEWETESQRRGSGDTQPGGRTRTHASAIASAGASAPPGREGGGGRQSEGYSDEVYEWYGDRDRLPYD